MVAMCRWTFPEGGPERVLGLERMGLEEKGIARRYSQVKGS